MRPFSIAAAAALLAVSLAAVSCSTARSGAPQAEPPAPGPAAAKPPEALPAARPPAKPAPPKPTPVRAAPPAPAKIYKTDAQWRAQLTPEQYRVTRHKVTEPKFSGAYVQHKAAGTYHCLCCGAKLFSSSAKYDHPCGWASFSAAAPRATETKTDHSYGLTRTEVLCARCDAHLGHRFDDGPAPSRRRFCINSTSLKFEPKTPPPPQP
jgi:peptide-methionine (R)-S-oxide reductase